MRLSESRQENTAVLGVSRKKKKGKENSAKPGGRISIDDLGNGRKTIVSRGGAHTGLE